VRIALVCPYAWQAAGGVQVHVRNLATRLLDRGHEVTVLSPTISTSSGGSLAGGAAAEPWVRSIGRPISVPYRGTVAPIAPTAFRRTRAALAGLRPDVIHVHEPLTPSASMFATLAATSPVVATVHAYLDRSIVMELAAPILRRVWRRVAVGIAVSEAAASFLRRAVPAAALEIVPNGVDVSAFSAAQPRTDLPAGRRILWVNRLDAQKGFPVALAAFSKVLVEIPDATLVVVGEGKDRESLRLLTEQALARVDMRGAVENAEVPGYHAACEVFLASAVGQESFGIAVVEAMAAGVPVVASDIPGYREVVTDGVDGLLVPPRDPEARAARRGGGQGGRALGERLGEAGRERARTFDWPIVVDRLEELYGRAIESAGYDRRT
jgi:phosphatidylinositol alpha-mannosyltransferase